MISKPVVVYDGECPFCQKQVAKMRSRDPGNYFEYAPRQTPGIEERFPTLAQGDFNTGMRLVRQDGSVAVGADAVYEIARELRGWRLGAWLYRVPILRQVFRGIYAWIARNRYRLAQKSGKICDPDKGACEL